MTTNFERIKNMTLDEMAVFLANYPENSCDFCGNWRKDCYLKCEEFIKERLKKEVENDKI